MYWLIFLSVWIFAPLAMWSYVHTDQVNWLTFITLALTLIVLIAYAYDTHRIADQTVETNIKPIVLRGGYIQNWNAIKFSVQANGITGTPVEFAIKKNIVMALHGYIIISNQKYPLLFGSPSISQVQSSQGSSSGPAPQITAVAFNPIWDWMAPDNVILAIFNPNQGEAVSQPNEIYVEYKDIAGNTYFMRQDQNFITTSGRK